MKHDSLEMLPLGGETASPAARGPIGNVLQHSKWAILVELVLFVGILFAVHFLFPNPFMIANLFLISITTSVMIVFVLLSLWLRGKDLRSIGLKAPARWRFIILVGIVGGIIMPVASSLISALVLTLLKPLIGSQTQNLSLFTNMLGHNVPALLGWLAVSWSFAAFGEEIIYRGYLMSRVTDLVGTSRAGTVISLLVSSIIFSFPHAYQGLAGMIQASITGLLIGLIYLIARRNLWASVLAHGLNDSIDFVFVFLFLVAK